MRDRFSIPRVFLSHSSLDKEFINRLAADLRKCQIDPWVDVEEIRDGRPWLKVIFEDGMPACDAVLAYFTENSLNSDMVAKEIDAAQIRRLQDAGVSFLPYVKNAALRRGLRLDLQSLHCREWNESSYHEVLPSVVAEIWRSYFERKISDAVAQEKSRRLELELEMKALLAQREASVFPPSVERDHQFIYGRLNRDIEITFPLLRLEGDRHVNAGEEVYQVNLMSALMVYMGKQETQFRAPNLAFYVCDVIDGIDSLADAEATKRQAERGSIKEKLSLELQTYGLLRKVEVYNFDQPKRVLEFTEKMYNLKYWLEFNNLVTDLAFQLVSKTEAPETIPPLVEAEDPDLIRAKEIDREVAFSEWREKWRTSQEGLSAALLEVKSLFAELERLASVNNDNVEKIKIDFHSDSEARCSLSSRGITLIAQWHLAAADSLNGSGLEIEEYKTKQGADGRPINLEEKNIYQSEYVIDIDREQKIFWEGKVKEGRRLSTGELAKSLIHMLRSTIRSRTIYGD